MQNISIPFNQIEPCPMCRQPFGDAQTRLPRIMNCGHSVCSECIKNQVRLRKSVRCLLCNMVFSKEECIHFKANQEYLRMVQFLETNFGKSLIVCRRPPEIKNEEPRRNNNQGRELENLGELIKCKNSGCLKMTDLIFCSVQCQAHYDEVETMKNEGGFRKGRFSD